MFVLKNNSHSQLISQRNFLCPENVSLKVAKLKIYERSVMPVYSVFSVGKAYNVNLLSLQRAQ